MDLLEDAEGRAGVVGEVEDWLRYLDVVDAGSGAPEGGVAAPDGARVTIDTETTPVSADVTLAPYLPWTPRPLSDPNGASQAEIITALVEIVTAEGPIVGRRAYELYVHAAGGQRVGKLIRSTLNRAAAAAVRAGKLAQIRDDQPGQLDKTLYATGSPEVRVRQRGPRALEHIPPTEVATLVRLILDETPTLDDEAIKRRLLELYDRVRLTTNASAFLDGCIQLARR